MYNATIDERPHANTEDRLTQVPLLDKSVKTTDLSSHRISQWLLPRNTPAHDQHKGLGGTLAEIFTDSLTRKNKMIRLGVAPDRDKGEESEEVHPVYASA